MTPLEAVPASTGRSGRVAGPAPRPQPRASAADAARRIDRRTILDRCILGLAVSLWAVVAAWLTLGLGDQAGRRVMADVGEAALDVLAGVMVLRAAQRAQVRRIRLGWAILAAATLCYAGGDGVWAALDLGGGTAASPSPADALYLSYYPMVAAALLLLQQPSPRRHDHLRQFLDSVTVVVGGGIVVWHTLFRPILASLDPNPLGAAMMLGYPIGDLVLLYGVAGIALRHRPDVDSSALTALVAGLVLMFVGDVGYGQLTLTGSFGLVRWPDVIYLSSTLLIALAGYFQAHPAAAANRRGRDVSRWLFGLPYLTLAAGYGVLAALAAGSVTGELMEVLLGVAVLTSMVIFRQELVLRENSRLLADQARRESNERLRALTANSSEAVLLVDRDGIVTDATPSVVRVLGVEVAMLHDRPIHRFLHAEDVERARRFVADVAAGRPVAQPVEWRVWDTSGVWRQIETVAANRLDDPSVGQIVLTTRDIRERKTLERQLTQFALHDLLTNLPNRTLFHDRVGQALASATPTRRRTTVFSIGLNGFKAVNQSLGHDVGDRVLRVVAHRLQASVGAADTCARLVSDEFAVLLDGDATTADAMAVGDRIRTALRQPIDLGVKPIEMTASIGVSTAEPNDCDAGTLLRRAEVARSVAQSGGGDRVVSFEPAMQEAAQIRFDLEADLRQAIDRGEFVLNYQPIVDLRSGDLVGGEALIRWDHPAHGRIEPSAFIPLAEQTGRIDEIGTWVLRTACVEASRWARLSPGRVPRIAVNVSAHELADPGFAWNLQASIAHANASPSWVTLELTESLLMQDSSALLDQLHAIRGLGVQLAIDDFGTGYSSLAYLERFPVSHLKIDRSFVTALDDVRHGTGVVHAIVEIGRALGLTTIAEGIETPTELRRLREQGCPFGQGFLFARPLEPDAMAALVARRHGPVFAAEIATASQGDLPRRAPAARSRRQSSAAAGGSVRG